MIRGENKPNGYFSTFTGDGVKLEGETYQCIHCQFMWIPKPGSKIRRGYCYKHGGMLCGRAECVAEQQKWTGNSYDCMTIQEYNDSIRHHVDKYHRLSKNGPAMEVLNDGKIKALEGDFGKFKTTPSGLIIPN